MDLGRDTVIGIAGGMGPQAGIVLLSSIHDATEANTDQQHLSTILMSFPRHIGDRTAFLEGKIPLNPAFAIAGVIQRLESAGARVAGIACNTAHSPAIFDRVLEELDKGGSQIRLLHMVEETCKAIGQEYPHKHRIGVMTTNGTYRAGIYEQELVRRGYAVVAPEQDFQARVVHRIIYDPEFGLKATGNVVRDEARALFGEAIVHLRGRGAELILLGCTELSLLYEAGGEPLPMIDSTRSLAKALVREATAEFRDVLPRVQEMVS